MSTQEKLSADTDAYLLRFTGENPTQWLWFQKRWNTPPEMKKTNKHHTARARRKSSEDDT